MGEVITGELSGSLVNGHYVDNRVSRADAQSLVDEFFLKANERELDCYQNDATIVPRAVFNDGLNDFFNKLNDGEIAPLPEDFQLPDATRPEYAMRRGDAVILEQCTPKPPIS